MIRHTGTITNIEKNFAEIVLQQTSACVSCHAKGMCMSFDKKERKITTPLPYSHNYTKGEEVNITLQTKHGYKAVLLAYIFPVLILVASIALFDHLQAGELNTILYAFALLAFYFIALKTFSVKLTQTITFQIEKINNRSTNE